MFSVQHTVYSDPAVQAEFQKKMERLFPLLTDGAIQFPPRYEKLPDGEFIGNMSTPFTNYLHEKLMRTEIGNEFLDTIINALLDACCNQVDFDSLCEILVDGTEAPKAPPTPNHKQKELLRTFGRNILFPIFHAHINHNCMHNDISLFKLMARYNISFRSSEAQVKLRKAFALMAYAISENPDLITQLSQHIYEVTYAQLLATIANHLYTDSLNISALLPEHKQLNLQGNEQERYLPVTLRGRNDHGQNIFEFNQKEYDRLENRVLAANRPRGTYLNIAPELNEAFNKQVTEIMLGREKQSERPQPEDLRLPLPSSLDTSASTADTILSSMRELSGTTKNLQSVFMHLTESIGCPNFLTLLESGKFNISTLGSLLESLSEESLRKLAIQSFSPISFGISTAGDIYSGNTNCWRNVFFQWLSSVNSSLSALSGQIRSCMNNAEFTAIEANRRLLNEGEADLYKSRNLFGEFFDSFSFIQFYALSKNLDVVYSDQYPKETLKEFSKQIKSILSTIKEASESKDLSPKISDVFRVLIDIQLSEDFDPDDATLEISFSKGVKLAEAQHHTCYIRVLPAPIVPTTAEAEAAADATPSQKPFRTFFLERAYALPFIGQFFSTVFNNGKPDLDIKPTLGQKALNTVFLAIISLTVGIFLFPYLLVKAYSDRKTALQADTGKDLASSPDVPTSYEADAAPTSNKPINTASPTIPELIEPVSAHSAALPLSRP